METIFHITLSITTTWLTYLLGNVWRLGAVRSSSLIAVIVGIFFQLNELYFNWSLDKDIPFVVFGSTFIGMITSRKHYRNFHLFFAPFIFVIIYQNISQTFIGFGGALGTAACISLVISIYLRSLKSTKKLIKPFRKLKIITIQRRKHITLRSKKAKTNS